MKDSLGRKISPIVRRKDWERILARVASDGKSIPQIAREEGCNERTLRRRCRAQGIVKVTHRDKAEVKAGIILPLYTSGLSCRQIADRLGLKEYAVVQLVKESSLPWRESYEYSYAVVPGSVLEKEICSRYPEMALEAIADLYRVGRNTARNILRRAGKDILPKGPRSHRKKVEDA
jgi:DNA-binding CsgD family transcriptional regulator